ncbi:MAG TPA: DUF362 domain-containing protein [Vicinamibacterales bacterium]|nr:DUF362 domain-containing protein [Vicinamibacterales bacterium]
MSPMLDACSVWIAAAPACDYRRVADPFPELPGFEPTSSAVALRTLFIEAGLDAAHQGKPIWNPLSACVRPGMKVVVKPNWVTHHNASSAGWECLITHPSVLDALCRYILKARPGRLTIGDAPVQGCDFARLLAESRTGDMVARLPANDTDIELKDFRLVTLDDDARGTVRPSDSRTDADYVRFDLAGDSLLDPITSDAAPFRVTMYDPRALDETHRRGRHRYLVARELIEADVVFNVPKLKTHKKAGITGALKNLVGINGHKAYLPHHRKGGADRGGDAYPGASMWKTFAEEAYDTANRLSGGRTKAALFRSAALLERAGESAAAPAGVEGSWHGNDTVWRMSLDLQRLLRYGRIDGTMADDPAREIVTVTDAIIAGEGEGPLAPTPYPLGLLTLGASPAAVEWVHAGLIGFDPRRIPIVAHAFDRVRFPVAPCAPGDIVVRSGGRALTFDDACRAFGKRLTPPSGWRGHCELVEAAAHEVLT